MPVLRPLRMRVAIASLVGVASSGADPRDTQGDSKTVHAKAAGRFWRSWSHKVTRDP